MEQLTWLLQSLGFGKEQILLKLFQINVFIKSIYHQQDKICSHISSYMKDPLMLKEFQSL